jgi:membrane protein YdbS with pleckstrin-like domain
MTDQHDQTGPGAAPPDTDVEGFAHDDPLDALIEERDSASDPETVDSPGPVQPDGLTFLQRMSWPADVFTPSEELVEASNPSPLASAPQYLIGGNIMLAAVALTLLDVTGILADIVSWLLPLGLSVQSMPSWAPRLYVLFGSIGLVIIAAGHIRRRYTFYILTDQRVLVRFRVLSRSIKALEYTNIKNAEVDETVPFRWFGVGDVELYTSGTDKLEVKLAMIRNPSATHTNVQQRLNNKQGQAGTDPVPEDN